MAKRSNHYDVAFEEFLRQLRRPYVAVDEARRALFRESSLKSMDFIVYAPQSTNLLVDVKGRQFPTGRHSWENWIMEEDISSLLEWEQVFGAGFRSLLVFAYELQSPRELAKHAVSWRIRSRWYAFYGVWARDYQSAMTCRSPNWKTVSLRARDFESLRQPVMQLL